MNLADTSGWIEYISGGPIASRFTPPIESPEKLLAPAICLQEVFKKVNSVADEARALRAVAQLKQGQIVDLTEDVARGATLWTQDELFRRLAGENYSNSIEMR